MENEIAYMFDYESATIAEIEERLNELREQKEAVQAELRFATQATEKMLAQQSALAKVAAMSPAERAALGLPEPQVVTAEGVESAEQVG